MKKSMKQFNVIKYVLSSIGFMLSLSYVSVAEEHIPGNITQTQSTHTILVLGDSLSAAYNLNLDEGWVALLSDKFNTEIHTENKRASTNYKIINASISGATTAAGLSILPQLLEQHKPKTVLLQLGANDGLQGKPISYITQNLRQLIELSQNINAKVILLGIRLPPNYGKAYTQPFFEQYGLLSEEYSLAYLPFLLEGVAGNNELMQSDGLHPNAKGQPIILSNVWTIVASTLNLTP